MDWWTSLRRHLCWHRQPRAWNFPQCALKEGEDWENIWFVCLYLDLTVAQGGLKSAMKLRRSLNLGFFSLHLPSTGVIGVHHGTGLCNVGEGEWDSGLGKLSTS